MSPVFVNPTKNNKRVQKQAKKDRKSVRITCLYMVIDCHIEKNALVFHELEIQKHNFYKIFTYFASNLIKTLRKMTDSIKSFKRNNKGQTFKNLLGTDSSDSSKACVLSLPNSLIWPSLRKEKGTFNHPVKLFLQTWCKLHHGGRENRHEAKCDRYCISLFYNNSRELSTII